MTVTLPPGLREARPDDVEEVLRLIGDLAHYEREPDAVSATTTMLTDALFGPDAVASALVADGETGLVGFALWYRTFSTWDGVPGIHLEDLYVAPEHRGRGLGRDLLVALARIADDRGWTRVEWAVLDWNTPSIAFYEGLGARPQADWTTYRLTGETLSELARRR